MRLFKVASNSSDEDMESDVTDKETTPSSTAPAPVFTELLELTEYSDGFREWKEVARWVKYEETVEEAGNRCDKFWDILYIIHTVSCIKITTITLGWETPVKIN